MNLFKSILALFLLLPLFSMGQINNHAANGSQAPDPDEFSWEMYSYQGGNWQVVSGIGEVRLKDALKVVAAGAGAFNDMAGAQQAEVCFNGAVGSLGESGCYNFTGCPCFFVEYLRGNYTVYVNLGCQSEGLNLLPTE